VQKINTTTSPEAEAAAHAIRPAGDVLLLENTRFDPRKSGTIPACPRTPAQLGDLVMSTMPLGSTGHVLTEGWPTICHRSRVCSWRWSWRRWGALHHPERPFVTIIGGADQHKIGVIENLLTKVDALLIGGHG